LSHSLVHIHPNAQIAENVIIEPFSVIGADVIIGKNTWIGSNVTIMDGARIGENCKIFPSSVIAAPPQDLKFEGEKTYVYIGDNTTIRECVTVNRGTKQLEKTTIGNNCLLMAYVHIAHDCIVGNNCILANSVQVGGHVHLDDYCVIGGITAIHQFSRVGKFAMVGSSSFVTKDVPPFAKAARNPLAYVGINSVGLRRNKFDRNQINLIQDIYRILYSEGLNNREAVLQIENKIEKSKERDEVLDFIKSSDRGIMKGYNT